MRVPRGPRAGHSNKDACRSAGRGCLVGEAGTCTLLGTSLPGLAALVTLRSKGSLTHCRACDVLWHDGDVLESSPSAAQLETETQGGTRAS